MELLNDSKEVDGLLIAGLDPDIWLWDAGDVSPDGRFLSPIGGMVTSKNKSIQ